MRGEKGRELPKFAGESFNEMGKKNKVQGKEETMSSKEDILASIRKIRRTATNIPIGRSMQLFIRTWLPNLCEMSFAVGGEAIVLGEGEDINAVIRRTYS